MREIEGITFLEHGLATKVCPCGSQGVAIALGPEARKARERAGSLRITSGPQILAARITIMDQNKRQVSFFLVSVYDPVMYRVSRVEYPDTSQPPEEQRARKEPAIQRETVANSAAPAHVHSSHAAHRAAWDAACMPTTRPHRAGPCGLRCALLSCSPGG